MPEISVLMSAYNAEKYIGQAIQSVLSQTFSDFELIIINDGSIDRTENIVDGFKDDRIKYFTQINQGVSKSLNRGLKIANGKYIARLDADDICHPDRLEKQYKFMEENPSYVVCGSYTEVIDDDGNFIYTYKDIPTTNEEIQIQFEYKNCIVNSSSFYKRENAISIGGYYEPIMQYFEDFMFFYNIIKTGKAYNFSEPLIKYRVTPGSISSRTNNVRYNKLVLDVIHRGYITDNEKKILFTYRNKKAKKHIQLSNHYLALSRLVFTYQNNYNRAYNYFRKSIRANLFNINIPISFFYMLYFYLFKRRDDKNN
jgi:glycosyltransferase involved in cell wall biosynthesis